MQFSKLKIRYFGIFLLFLLLGIISVRLKSNRQFIKPPPVHAQTDIPWPMAGANPQRTSWTPENLPGNIATVWVKPIKPYISQHVQVIGAGGKVFVATAKGLYAFNADTGAQAWVYPTELPLGHSPTYDNGALYVGGMDRKLHAVNASTGTGIWTYTAEGGFYTNPVVANGKVYAGNRDGAFYAVNTSNGSLAWKYQTGNQILQSSAFKTEDDGISGTLQGSLFFASNDGYAYALNAQSGGLVWKSSQKLPSMGFYSWWPVIYQNYAIFTRTPFGGNLDNPWLYCPPDNQFCSTPNNAVPGQLGYEPGNWVSGMSTMNVNLNNYGRTYANFFETFPHYRTAFFFNRSTGQEVAFDIDNDGITDGAPVSFAGDAGTHVPPVVSGFDNVLYFRTNTRSSGGFGSKTIAGWKVSTPFMSLPYSNTFGQSGFWPGDEPVGMSAAGNKIYWNLCCDRYVGAVDLSLPNRDFLSSVDDGDPVRQWRYISSGGLPFTPFTNIGMPGNYYEEAKKFFWDPPLPAVFWNENDKVGPAAYNGKLYVILGNALVAFGQGGAGSNAPMLSSAVSVSPPTNPPTFTYTQLKTRLEQEVSEIVSTGHLKPSFIMAGGVTSHHSRAFDDYLSHYWHNPADIQLVLLRALPHLSATLQQQVKTYLQNEFANYPPYTYAHIGFTEGVQRDPYPYPPAETVFRTFTIPNLGKQFGSSGPWGFPPHNIYAMWKYAAAGLGNPATLFSAWGTRLKTPITANDSKLTDLYLQGFPLVHNAYIAAYKGYVELAKLAGQSQSQYGSFETELNRLLSLRVQQLMTFPNPQEPFTCENECYYESLITYFNFAYLTPELADYLSANARSSDPDKDILAILQKYQDIAPYWMAAHNGETQGESAIQPYQQTYSLFQALALVKKASREELVKYLDTPIVPVGDLYYIDNLISAIAAPSSGSPTLPPVPTQTPILFPTFTPTKTPTPSPSNTPTPPAPTLSGSPTPTPTPYLSPIPITQSATGNFSILNINQSTGTVVNYEKFEVNFDISGTVATNFDFPFDPNPPAGISVSNARYNGISVNAVFTDPQGNSYLQPAFYYQEFDDQVKAGKEWFYPKGTFKWKVRFSPNKVGTWNYKITAQDKNGQTTSNTLSFNVSSSENKGFIKTSTSDPRYFEYDDGTYFPALGYNLNGGDLDNVNPVLGNSDKFQKMGANGIELSRVWISQFSIYGEAWGKWGSHNPFHATQEPRMGIVNPVSNQFANYNTLIPPAPPIGSENYMWLDYDEYLDTVNNNQPRFTPCRYITNIPVRQNTDYRLRVRYKDVDLEGPRVIGLPFGFAVKRGGWLWDTTDITKRCYYPGTGTVLAATYNPPAGQSWSHSQDPQNPNWSLLEGTFNSGTSDFLGNFYLTFDNVKSTDTDTIAGHVFIDQVQLEEASCTQNCANLIYKPSMSMHQYVNQRDAYSFDKLLNLSEQNGVYLKAVMNEKNDRIFQTINYDGQPISAQDDDYFYGNNRQMTKVRWLQQAWWRYIQARWGYSPNIHSWELLNEGDPGNTKHWVQADEFGKYMKCRVFGREPVYDTAVGNVCLYDHPNAHPISTSFWGGNYPWYFWNNTDKLYADVDYVDQHLYATEGSTDPAQFYDSAYFSYWLSTLTNIFAPGKRKPFIRGEVAWSFNGTDVLANNSENGEWLHDFIWAGINHGGLMEHFFAGGNFTKQIYNIDKSGVHHDHRPMFKTFYNFIKDIPLNNGNYKDAAAISSNTNIRAWGQKDSLNNRAHLWISNKNHTWKNVVDAVSITPQSGTVTVPGFTPNISLKVETWNTNTGQAIILENKTADNAGNIVLNVAGLTADYAVRMGDYQQIIPTIQPTASPLPAISPTTTTTPTPSKTLTPTPITALTLTPTISVLSPSPTPSAPCNLTSATWPKSQAIEGETLALKVEATGNCSNLQVSFKVREADSLLEGGFDEDAKVQPANATFAGSQALTSWTVEWQNDCAGFCNPPEYYFDATLLNASVPTIRSSDPKLTVTQGTIGPQAPAWPMAGANPQRTSWTPEDIPGNLKAQWVKPIEPYIPQKVQAIAANDSIFISTAKGLYAIDSETGTEKWVYATDLPLGNSPTFDNGVVYVGGLDKKLHAVNATSGQKIWTFSAEGGFDTNPLVINGKVYAGNRDTYIYAVNAATGQLVWKFKTGGQILQSAAYTSGIVIVPSKDAYVYALNADTGALVWKSAKIPGMGFRSWWPVIYKDFVVLVKDNEVGDKQITPWLFPDPTGDKVPGVLGNESGDWAQGETTMNMATNPYGGSYPDYYEQFPNRRQAIFLNRTTGQEIQFDLDNDGLTDAAPISFNGDAGTRYPPVVSGFDNVLYFRSTNHAAGPSISGATLIGWKVGTPIMSLPYSDNTGQSGFWPSDEPNGISGGGSKIYVNHTDDRLIAGVDISQPNKDYFSHLDDINRQWKYVNQDSQGKLTSLYLPSGYHQEATKFYWNPPTPASFWGENDKVAPIVYKGKLYSINSNALIAFSPTGQGTAAPILGKASFKPAQTFADSVSDSILKSKLETEIQKLVNAGHLKPGFGVMGGTAVRIKTLLDEYGLDYWHNPQDLVYVLTRALPHLSSTLQNSVKAYLQSEFNAYPPYSFSHIGWLDGNWREPYIYQPDILTFAQYAKNFDARSNSMFSGWSGIPPHNVYAIWKYAKEGLGDPATLFSQVQTKLKAPITANKSNLTDEYLTAYPHVHNAFITGYIGYIELAKLAGQPSSAYAAHQAELQRLLSLRYTNFNWYMVNTADTEILSKNYFYTLITAWNFMNLVPESANYLNQNILAEVADTITRYENMAPYWMQAENGETQGENAIMSYLQTKTLFDAKALILKESKEELAKFLDTPIVPVGDLYYIDNLVSILNATSSGQPTLTPQPTAITTPSPTPPLQPTSAAPLIDMGTSTYEGFAGGLYENSQNIVPADHQTAGLQKANSVQPLDINGISNSSGKIVLLSIGMSNTFMEWCSGPPCVANSFMGQSSVNPLVDKTKLTIVNGAQGTQTAEIWASPTSSAYDVIRDQWLTPAGVSEKQVQVIWVKNAHRDPTSSLPNLNADAYKLETNLGAAMRAIKVRYPNVKLVFLSSRVYGGYATGAAITKNPEPYAFEGGFSVKWLIQGQIDQMRQGNIVDSRAGDLNYNTVAPWIGWGPYLWADDNHPRSDGLTYAISDFIEDGTHPSSTGILKVGTQLLNFFLNSAFTRCWFRNDSSTCSDQAVSGDANGDNKVDGIDYVIWLSNYESTTTSGSSKGDFNSDGKVDGIDYVLWVINYGK